jgi:hypothetical protein
MQSRDYIGVEEIYREDGQEQADNDSGGIPA